MFVAVFWIAVLTVAYTYLAYPLGLFVYSRLWPSPICEAEITPSISMIVACHNEGRTIGAKIQNIAQLDYPHNLLEVIVASDGSTDGTSELAKAAAAESLLDRATIEVLDLPRVGKAAALNSAVARAKGEILVFTDSNSMFDRSALRNLARPFADDRVGGVAGNQCYRKSKNKHNGDSPERSYWSYDRFLKSCESQVGSVVSATGAIYAIRHDLFVPVPAGVTDDFVTSTRVVEKGYRLVFAVDAIAYEPVAGSTRAEFSRKVRLMTRGQRSLWIMKRLLNPFRYGLYAFELWSHKLLRRLLFVPLVAALVASIALWGESAIYTSAAVLQLAFYGAAMIGLVSQRITGTAPRWLALPAYFVMANAAACIATFNLLRGYQIDMWNPQRHAAPM